MENRTDPVEWYKEMLREDPASQVFASMAEILYTRGQWSETVRVCRWGLGIHPSHLRAQVLLGLALWQSGRKEEARKELEKAREKLEENALLYLALSELAEDEGDEALARRYRRIHQGMEGEDTEPEPAGTGEQPSDALVSHELERGEGFEPLWSPQGKISPEASETLSDQPEEMTESAPAAEPVEEVAAEPSMEESAAETLQQEEKRDSVLALLQLWQQTHLEKETPESAQIGLFTEDDRQAIRRILENRRR